MQSNSNVRLSWVRQEKQSVMLGAYGAGILKKEQLRIEIYDNAVISPYFYQPQTDPYAGAGTEPYVGGVFEENGKPVSLSKINAFTPIGNIHNECIYSDESVVYCGGCGHVLHWGHFLVDVVPRLWYALLENREADLYIIIGTDGIKNKLGGNFLEFLKLLGIEKKVYILSKTTKFKQVIIPEKSYDFNEKYHYYTDEFLNTFGYVVRKALSGKEESIEGIGSARKVFMTRKQSRDAGIELIDSVFANNGFEVLDPAAISLAELIVKLQMCETIAYVSGTLQHNMLFAPSGVRAIAIERRANVSPWQIDIDLIKNIRADYIDAHYSIIPDYIYYYSLYGYTKELRRYIRDNKLEFPDISYCSKSYCEDSIKKYMRNYTMSFFKRAQGNEEWMQYIFADYEESIKELNDVFGIKMHLCREGFFDIEKAARGIKEILVDLSICYGEWNDHEWRIICDFFSKLIYKILKKSKPYHFLIYPFGKNGMLLKQILKEQFGIEDIIAFDNQLSRENESIKPLYKIKDYSTEDNCIILTSAKRECWEELSSYIDLIDIEGPFSIV